MIRIKEKQPKKKKLKICKLENVDFKTLDFLVLSPGIKSIGKNKHISAKKAQENNVKIISDIEFLTFLNKPKTLIGITGTNGKSTTTKFTENLLSYKKKIKASACGNIGLPFTSLKNKKTRTLIVEASSFQLDRIENLKFDIAVLLNITNDHLDWHLNMQSYISAKLNIFKNQDENCNSIICIDDSICKKIAKNFKTKFKSKLILISTDKNKVADITLFEKKNKLEIHNKLINKKILLNKKNFKFTKVKHNYQNLLAAYAIQFLFQEKNTNFSDAIKELNNLEHRMECLGYFKNLTIYNDSKATNMNASLTALDSLEKSLWILGGRAKKGDIIGIKEKKKKILQAYTFGESGAYLDKYLKKNLIKSKNFLNLQDAINAAYIDGIKFKKKINILFSPACSSYDQFKNFEKRGNFFKNLVKKINEKF